jgi:hypothetical protein
MGGEVATSRVTSNPRATALLIALTLVIYPTPWDDFFKREKLLKDVKSKQTLRKEHDEIEKQLNEIRIP